MSHAVNLENQVTEKQSDARQSRAYARRAARVTAIPWDGTNLVEVQAFCLGNGADRPGHAVASPAYDGKILSLPCYSANETKLYPSLGKQYRQVAVMVGDVIVRGEDGELAVVPAEAFAREYLPVADEGGPSRLLPDGRYGEGPVFRGGPYLGSHPRLVEAPPANDVLPETPPDASADDAQTLKDA